MISIGKIFDIYKTKAFAQDITDPPCKTSCLANWTCSFWSNIFEFAIPLKFTLLHSAIKAVTTRQIHKFVKKKKKNKINLTN